MFVALRIFVFAVVVSAYKPLSESFLRSVPSGGSDFNTDNGALLAPILIPRVPNTVGQSKAQQHFVDFFRNELPKWKIEWHNSTFVTPATGTKEVPFANLVFKREPPWTKPGQANFLTFAAHYDSKYMSQGYTGATDNAASCAILMHLARSVDPYLTQMHDEMEALQEGGTIEMDMGIQIILLDGKEAYMEPMNAPALYGSRFLAEEWEMSTNPAMSFYRNTLNQISMLVQLDLLGSANPTVPSYFLTTHWAFNNMAAIEKRMRSMNLLESKPSSPFLSETNELEIQARIAPIISDHLPFMERGVNVLHTAPSPFPSVWHTKDDDGKHLDTATVKDWAKITTAFALEWLDMMEVWPDE